MSRFGDDNFKSDIYENLGWVISDNIVEKINFLHYNIIELAKNGPEYISDFISHSITNRNLTIQEALESLGEVYLSLVTYDLLDETT